MEAVKAVCSNKAYRLNFSHSLQVEECSRCYNCQELWPGEATFKHESVCTATYSSLWRANGDPCEWRGEGSSQWEQWQRKWSRRGGGHSKDHEQHPTVKIVIRIDSRWFEQFILILWRIAVSVWQWIRAASSLTHQGRGQATDREQSYNFSGKWLVMIVTYRHPVRRSEAAWQPHLWRLCVLPVMSSAVITMTCHKIEVETLQFGLGHTWSNYYIILSKYTNIYYNILNSSRIIVIWMFTNAALSNMHNMPLAKVTGLGLCHGAKGGQVLFDMARTRYAPVSP